MISKRQRKRKRNKVESIILHRENTIAQRNVRLDFFSYHINVTLCSLDLYFCRKFLKLNTLYVFLFQYFYCM